MSDVWAALAGLLISTLFVTVISMVLAWPIGWVLHIMWYMFLAGWHAAQ